VLPLKVFLSRFLEENRNTTDASYSVMLASMLSPIDFGLAFLFFSGLATATALSVLTVLSSTSAAKHIISWMFSLSKAI
jgi:hypothetical protein